MALVMSSGNHFGGLLGGGGLAIVAAGCLFLQAQQAGPSWTVPTSASGGIEGEANRTGPPIDFVPPRSMTFSDLPDAPVEPVDRTSLQNEPDIIAASGPPTIAPVPSFQPARQPVPAQGAGEPVQPATFIVKFKESDAIDEVIANWRRDRDAAEAAYAAWAEDDPLFSMMDVVGCSYSGELILEASVPAAPAAARARVNALVDLIRAHSAVAYADPDFIAQPGLSENE